MNDLRLRLTAIGHAGMALMNPLPSDVLDEAIARIGLAPGARAIDFGCGKAEVVSRVAERYAADGVGVEISPHLIGEARARAAHVTAGRVEIVQGDALEHDGASLFDFVALMGPGWAHDGVPDLLVFGRQHLAPGGALLVGDGCWRRTPTGPFLDLLGARSDELLSHDGNLAAAREAGFDVAWSAATSLEDSDRYETRYGENLDRWVAEHRADPDAAAVAAWATQVRARYQAGGREQLGFAAYLLRDIA